MSNLKLGVNKNRCHGYCKFHTNTPFNLKIFDNSTHNAKGHMLYHTIEHKGHVISNIENIKVTPYINLILHEVFNERLSIFSAKIQDINNKYVHILISSTTKMNLKKSTNSDIEMVYNEYFENNVYKYDILNIINSPNISQTFELFSFLNINDYDIIDCKALSYATKFNQYLTSSNFRINTTISGTYDDSDVNIVNKAVNKWKSIIYGPIFSWLSQEINITVNFVNLGNEYILGSAGPTAYINYNSNFYPTSGIVNLNTLNWPSQKKVLKKDGNNQAYYTLLHELGHVLGLGTLWENPSNGSPRTNILDPTEFKYVSNSKVYTKYIGNKALDKYRLTLNDMTLTGIPIEDDGGLGTAGGHVEEGNDTQTYNRFYDGNLHPGLDRELMTGYSENDNEPEILSSITIAMLEDLGYNVKYSIADDILYPNWINSNNVYDGYINESETLYVDEYNDNSLKNNYYVSGFLKGIAIPVDNPSTNFKIYTNPNGSAYLYAYEIEYVTDVPSKYVDILEQKISNTDIYNLNFSSENVQINYIIIYFKPTIVN